MVHRLSNRFMCLSLCVRASCHAMAPVEECVRVEESSYKAFKVCSCNTALGMFNKKLENAMTVPLASFDADTKQQLDLIKLFFKHLTLIIEYK